MISWHDAIKGEISVDSSDLGGDMVIVKSSGVATYNFAVVVDDIDMNMTHVIRGEDHIHNTAKQIMIYEALGKTPPVFGHTALIQDTEHRKLSKRLHGESVHIDKYRLDGYLPEAMVNYLAQMSWTPPDEREIFTLTEAAEIFELDRVSKSAAVFDIQRLNWFNGHYIRSLPLPIITDRAMPYLQDLGVDQFTREELEHLVASVRDGLALLSEITEAARFYFDTRLVVPSDIRESVLNTDSAKKVFVTHAAAYQHHSMERCSRLQISRRQNRQGVGHQGKRLVLASARSIIRKSSRSRHGLHALRARRETCQSQTGSCPRPV